MSTSRIATAGATTQPGMTITEGTADAVATLSTGMLTSLNTLSMLLKLEAPSLLSQHIHDMHASHTSGHPGQWEQQHIQKFT